MTNKELKPEEFNEYYGRYIYKLANNVSLIEGFKNGANQVQRFFESIPEHKHDFRYKTNKWSLKEILQHLIDTERIFIYRTFRIARNDKTALAGFNQDDYVLPSKASHKTMNQLLEEFKTGRNNSISILESLSSSDLETIGNSNGSPMSSRAAAFTIIGHDIWHMDVINERYL
nr:DinB family protein [uncultured Psychroserpens sp.]